MIRKRPGCRPGRGSRRRPKVDNREDHPIIRARRGPSALPHPQKRSGSGGGEKEEQQKAALPRPGASRRVREEQKQRRGDRDRRGVGRARRRSRRAPGLRESVPMPAPGSVRVDIPHSRRIAKPATTTRGEGRREGGEGPPEAAARNVGAIGR